MLEKPRLMAILNLTPDSFSDGGQYNSLDAALKRSEVLIQQGADMLDIGGESTRPGAEKIDEQEEMDRVLPVLENIKKHFEIPVSVDTSHAVLMKEALKLKADMINDVRAFARVDDLSFLKASDCKLCLMHMQGEPENMQKNPEYQDVLQTVKTFLKQGISHCEQAGIEKSRLVIDPGFGFGKTLQHNLRLLNHLEELQELSCPILVGTSRKSMIGMALKKQVNERLYGSLATMSVAIQKGAAYLRVHDVSESRDVLDMTWAIMCEEAV